METLTKKEMKDLVEIGKAIRSALECDVNGQGLPCRTDRLDAVRSMIHYLKIHDYGIFDRSKFMERLDEVPFEQALTETLR